MSHNAKQSSRIGILLSLYVALRVLLPFPGTLVWAQTLSSNWNGAIHTDGFPSPNEGTVLLESGTNHYSAGVNREGAFSFQNLNAGIYSVTVHATGKFYRSSTKVSFPPADTNVTFLLSRDGSMEIVSTEIGRVVDTDQLTNKGVSEIPLNKRDFSQILLLAAGTSSDTNGASNFTQQFAISGQRGVEQLFRSTEQTSATRKWEAGPSPTSMSTQSLT
jgi:ER membrane protein complex subunit 7, beta-sandwich domain